jgi:isocitrate dehydrogenase (NAD+)
MGEPLVIPTLNRDGDLLSDLVMQLFGSIAGAESLLLSFDDEFKIKAVMAEAPHGTAPRLFRKNLANPMAMILAAGALLEFFPNDEPAHRVSQVVHDATFEVVNAGTRTVDLGGQASTTEFTDAVIAQVRERLGS